MPLIVTGASLLSSTIASWSFMTTNPSPIGVIGVRLLNVVLQLAVLRVSSCRAHDVADDGRQKVGIVSLRYDYGIPLRWILVGGAFGGRELLVK